MGTNQLTKEEVKHDLMRSHLTDLEFSGEVLKTMSAHQIFDFVIRYEGIIGYTDTILDIIRESNRIARSNNQQTIEV